VLPIYCSWLVRKGRSSGTNAVRVSGTVADVDLGLQGTVDGPEVVIDASTTIAGVKLGLDNNRFKIKVTFFKIFLIKLIFINHCKMN
jgi:hypothetical protein